MDVDEICQVLIIICSGLRPMRLHIDANGTTPTNDRRHGQLCLKDECPQRANRRRSRQDPYTMVEQDGRSPFLDLPHDIQSFIFRKYNEQAAATTARSLCKATRAFWPHPPNKPLSLARPLPAWLIQTAFDQVADKAKLMASVVESGEASSVAWLHAHGVALPGDVCTRAAQKGHLDLLKWARSRGCPWGERPCSGAAKHGHLEVLKYARGQGCPWDEGTCSLAAAGGHLEVLKWARHEGCPWDKSTSATAAAGGHLEVLKYARGQGCPWDEGTCALAAACGHLEVLEWVRHEGCPWDEFACQNAVARGHLELVKWAVRRGAPVNALVVEHVGEARVLEWQKGGVPRGRARGRAAPDTPCFAD